ncbi:hypothetical protein BIT28_14090 [Photobacterium proteolyticum]|uniref:Uncharacterized protein n=1 Tax=Photobacterium proteolyticum TaxID=1903952 RepID=A0A1Q9H7A9_9GAMM|nr:hypothetical protein [Photobacterium proteolyticum]OLQ83754.1 hypothetical protein BIT28_14090 [Photobacterium proteolyticum]
MAFGVITAALLTGVFTFVNLIISKEQKTSEFRQEWINELRKEITEFTSSVATFTNYLLHIKKRTKNIDEFNSESNDFYKDNMTLPIDIMKRYNSILLRLNPKDDEVLIKKLTALNNIATSRYLPESVNVVSVATNELIAESQKLLKKEWKRVKRGEVSFFLTKWGVLILLISAISFSIYHHEEIYAALSSQFIVNTSK